MPAERMTDERLEEIRVLARQHDEYIQREFPSRPPVVTPLTELLAEVDRLRANEAKARGPVRVRIPCPTCCGRGWTQDWHSGQDATCPQCRRLGSVVVTGEPD